MNDVQLDDKERQPCEVWTRVMGYHRPVASFNTGKKGEHAERRFFTESKAKAVAACAVAAAMTGCAAPDPQRIYVEMPCSVAVPVRPVMPTESLSPDVSLDEFVRAAAAEIERREGYEIELKAAVEACK